MADEMKKPTVEYEVGYGKPPKATQFQKGKSGNPKGRPKGAKNTDTMLQEILNEHVEVGLDGRKRRMSQKEVMLRRQILKAQTGDSKAFDQVMRRIEKQEDRNAAAAAISSNPPVLIVPAKLDPGEWERVVGEQQAKYAGNVGEGKKASG